MPRYRFEATANVTGHIVVELEDDAAVERWAEKAISDPNEVLQLLLDQGGDATDASFDGIDVEVNNRWVWWPTEDS